MNNASALDSISSYGRRQLLQASHQVLGVGIGVFLLGFFLVICVVLGLLGSRTTKPGLAYGGAAALYGVVVVVLLASPKGSPPPPSPVGYDETAVPLVIMIVLMCAGALSSIVGMLLFHLRAAIYARPLSYHRDVLNQQ